MVVRLAFPLHCLIFTTAVRHTPEKDRGREECRDGRDCFSVGLESFSVGLKVSQWDCNPIPTALTAPDTDATFDKSSVEHRCTATRVFEQVLFQVSVEPQPESSTYARA